MRTTEPDPKNDFYAGYLYNKFFDPLTNHMRDLICSHIPVDTSVIDVGCGTGYQLFKMASTIDCGVGVDLADRMISFARDRQKKEKVNNLNFVLGSAVDLSQFDDNEFDLATMTLVLHELDPDLQAAALKEMARVSTRQIIADWVVSPGLLRSSLIYLMEGTAGISHFHSFRAYLKEKGVPGLCQKTGLSIIQDESAFLDMVGIWICEGK
jgi:SAM-dependent methyltransferase